MNSSFFTLLFLSVFSFQFSAFSQGSLTPPGAPAPTMKTLAQVEPRTPISSAPFTISSSGSYYLTTNITVATGDAITIAANNVTLDLNGFTIASTRPTATTDSAILLSGGRTNVAIYNGHISSGVTITAGVFGGSGFGSGIYYSGTSPSSVRVKDVSVAGVLRYGILLELGHSTVVESCTVATASLYGIEADNVSDSTAVNCGNYGIVGDTTHNCKGNIVGDGIGVHAVTANNSYGSSSGSGVGLSATIANNCYGSSSSGTGLSATEAASNCRGLSGGAGFGVYAGNASNCRGNSSSGVGVNAAYTASFCSGVSSTGTGLSATIAIACTASSVDAAYKYLMP
jgi:hypothetical protein